MKNQTLTQLANQIVAIRSAAPSALSTIPQPLVYKSGANTSAMIALFLPTSSGVHFIQSDPNALPPSELHVTLAYLGKADDLSLRQVKEAHDLMKLISENHPPLTGDINGCGRFCNGDDEGDPFFIIPDLAALPNLRELIVMWLKGNDIPIAQDHGFVPHITLTYLPHAEYNPFDILEKTPISFHAISLVLGDNRYDYPLAQGVPLLSKAALIEKIGARHAHHEILQIQHIHDLTLELGAECHPLTRRAGARHSHADQGMVQRIHDDCSGLGAVCKGLPKKDRVYESQVLKEGPGVERGSADYQKGGLLSKEKYGALAFGPSEVDLTTRAQSDAPNYKAASTPQRCANCRFFLGDPGRDWCELFDFTADQDYRCDAWEAQRPDEIPGYVANKGDLAALTEGILILRGGPTSGNWGHVGRKGKRGGSGGGGGFGKIGVKPGASRKTVKQAAKKKQAKAKPKVKPKVTVKKPTAKPKAAAKKPSIKKPDAKLQKAKGNLATAKKKRDTELKSVVDLERRRSKAQSDIRNKKNVLNALNTIDDVDAKLKGQSSKKILDQYNKDTKANSEIVFSANLKEAKVARNQMKKQLQANTKAKTEAKKNVKQAETEAVKAHDKWSKSKKQFGIGDPRTVEASDAMLSSLDDFKAAKTNLSKVDTQSKNQMLDILKVSNPANTKISADSSKTTKAKRKEWQNTMDDVNKLVSADVTTPGHEVRFTTQGKKVRAHALPPGDEIVIRTDQQSRVIAHEVAHTIEMKNPRILQRAEQWRDNRTKGEREQLLSKVTGNKNYRKDEKTKPDKFVDPYVGKSYKNATEVISMGLERMFDDPVKFAKDDDDMFDFIYAVLRSG